MHAQRDVSAALAALLLEEAEEIADFAYLPPAEYSDAATSLELRQREAMAARFDAEIAKEEEQVAMEKYLAAEKEAALAAEAAAEEALATAKEAGAAFVRVSRAVDDATGGEKAAAQEAARAAKALYDKVSEIAKREQSTAADSARSATEAAAWVRERDVKEEVELALPLKVSVNHAIKEQ
jgi:hypothetical protein